MKKASKLLMFLTAIFCLFASHAYAGQETDNSGITVFQNLPEGEYHITVSKEGYIQRTATAEIKYIDGLQNVTVTLSLLKSVTSGTIVNRPTTPNESDNNSIIFTHGDYLAKFEHLGLNLEDMYAPITRAEIANIFSEMFEMEHKNDGMTFHDLDENKWYHAYVHDVAKKQIMIGYHDGAFRPLENITRAEIATVIVRTMQYEENCDSNFSDIEDSHWASGFISKIAASGIMVGDGDGIFRPDDGVTRAEVVIILNRLLGFDISGEDIYGTEK